MEIQKPTLVGVAFDAQEFERRFDDFLVVAAMVRGRVVRLARSNGSAHIGLLVDVESLSEAKDR